MYDANTIAWLIPPSRTAPFTTTTSLSPISIPLSSAPDLTSRLPSLLASRPPSALLLSFTTRLKTPGRFTLGTDPAACDIVLPPYPGIAAVHCALRFDACARLVLDDFSSAGTQVWFDWHSDGDRVGHTWVLDPAPTGVQRITVDVQGVRFQVVVNDHSSDYAAYTKRVEAFQPKEEIAAWADGWEHAALLSAVPMLQNIFVKGVGEGRGGEMYLWDLSRPWEPMVPASA